MENQNVKNFPRYERYKDSGVDWIGEIPEHWEIERAKWLFLKMERAVRPEDEIVTCFRDGEVTLRKNRRTDGFTNAALEHGYQGIRKNDLVIHAMDAFAGAIGISDSDGKSTPVYSACIPRIKNKVEVRFYAYYLRHLALTGFIQSLARGIRERSTDFRFSDFSELSLPFPPPPEQTAIAQFLDHKTAQIDRAIAIKEEQIKLLNERKQIMIQEAVTKGLDPTVPMKDSGVEWIGDIPEHWEVKSLGNLLNIISERNRSDLPLLSITRERGIILRDVDDLDSNHNYIPDDLSNYKVIREGQFGMNKMKAWQGSYGISKYDGIVSPAYYVFELSEKIYSDFFHHAIRSQLYVGLFFSASDGVRIGQWDLSQVRMRRIVFIIPTIEEQKEIVNHIESYFLKNTQTINHLNDEIKVLKEYKTTLINEAVTGKININ